MNEPVPEPKPPQFLGDQDERAAIHAAFYEALGRPYRFRLRGDGRTWVSIETVPLERKPPAP